MTPFVGRFAELRELDRHRDAIHVGDGGTAGGLVLLSGPAGVGKTRLLGEFLRRGRMPALFFAAGPGGPAGPASGTDAAGEQVAAFAAQAAASPLPCAGRFRDILVPDWDTALRLLADGAGRAVEPVVVVIDNAERLMAADRTFLAALRRSWSGPLREAPLLVILAGADLRSLADALPGSVTVTLEPFDPAELATLLHLDAASALEAYLVTGGHADIVAQWPAGAAAPDAVAAMLTRSPTAFEVRAELTLARDFGLGSQQAALLRAAGAGASGRAAIGRLAGLPPASLDRSLSRLAAAGYLTVDRPRSLRPSREARYRVADPYLRLWMPTVGAHREDLARGDVSAVLDAFRDAWPAWRRDAMEVTVRAAMHRLATRGLLPGTGAVGGYWTRFDDVHVDLVGTDADENPGAVTFVGACRWELTPFDHYALASLIAVRDKVPGVTPATPLVAVSLAGSAVGDGVAAVLGPDELITAWTA